MRFDFSSSYSFASRLQLAFMNWEKFIYLFKKTPLSYSLNLILGFMTVYTFSLEQSLGKIVRMDMENDLRIKMS